METNPKRTLVELIWDLSKRAQQVAHHNFDELGIENETQPNQALFCFLLALEEHKNSLNQQP